MQERKYIYAREIYICKKENIYMQGKYIYAWKKYICKKEYIYMQGKYIYARNFFIQAFSIVRIWSVFYFYIINKKTCKTKSSKRKSGKRAVHNGDFN